MKTSRISCLCVLAFTPFVALGGTTLLFTNSGLDAPVLDLRGNPLLPSDDYRVELFSGIYQGALDHASFTAPAVFTSPGVFGEGDAPITLRNLAPFPQSAYWFEVRVWNTRGGKYLTYGDAWDHGETELGKSVPFHLTVPWGDTSSTPPVEAPALHGLTSFTFPVTNIPEPSTYVLMAIGMGWLGWLGWRKSSR